MGISEFLDLMYLFNQDLSFESDSSSCVLTYKRSGLPSISRLPLINYSCQLRGVLVLPKFCKIMWRARFLGEYVR